MENHIGKKLLILLFVLALIHMASYYPRLPDRLASHFDAGGHPNGYSSKNGLFAMYIGMVILMGFLLPGIGFFLKKIPANLISLPNREFWFAPERRDETCRILQVYFDWMGCGTLILLMLAMHQTFRYNLGDREGFMDSFWWVFAGYMAFILIWSGHLWVRFMKKPASPGATPR